MAQPHFVNWGDALGRGLQTGIDVGTKLGNTFRQANAEYQYGKEMDAAEAAKAEAAEAADANRAGALGKAMGNTRVQAAEMAAGLDENGSQIGSAADDPEVSLDENGNAIAPSAGSKKAIELSGERAKRAQAIFDQKVNSSEYQSTRQLANEAHDAAMKEANQQYAINSSRAFRNYHRNMGDIEKASQVGDKMARQEWSQKWWSKALENPAAYDDEILSKINASAKWQGSSVQLKNNGDGTFTMFDNGQQVGGPVSITNEMRSPYLRLLHADQFDAHFGTDPSTENKTGWKDVYQHEQAFSPSKLGRQAGKGVEQPEKAGYTLSENMTEDGGRILQRVGPNGAKTDAGVVYTFPGKGGTEGAQIIVPPTIGKDLAKGVIDFAQGNGYNIVTDQSAGQSLFVAPVFDKNGKPVIGKDGRQQIQTIPFNEMYGAFKKRGSSGGGEKPKAINVPVIQKAKTQEELAKIADAKKEGVGGYLKRITGAKTAAELAAQEERANKKLAEMGIK